MIIRSALGCYVGIEAVCLERGKKRKRGNAEKDISEAVDVRGIIDIRDYKP